MILRSHMLDANENLVLNAPDSGDPNTIWFNITVADIVQTHKSLSNKCIEMQPVTEMMEGAIQNSLFVGPNVWLHDGWYTSN